MHFIDTKSIIPRKVLSGVKGSQYEVSIVERNKTYLAYYYTRVANQVSSCVGKKKHFFYFSKKLILNEKDFEVLGLLQGEMSKTKRGPLTFANSQPNIINAVLDWFESSFKIKRASWHWYIKVNLKEYNEKQKLDLTKSLTEYWIDACSLDITRAYKKAVVFTRNTKNCNLRNFGTLMIERRGPLFVQTVQNLVYIITAKMPFREEICVKGYLRGIIAAEGTVNFNREKGIFRVFISAKKQSERTIFIECLKKLEIASYDCKSISTLVISRKDNILKMAKFKLLEGHPEKSKLFYNMLGAYKNLYK